MMETQAPTIDEAIDAVTCGCVGCVSVPLSILQLDVDTPLGGWEPLFAELNIKTLTDHIGRRSVSAAAARQLLKAARRRDELFAEDLDRRTAELAAKYPVPVAVGVPAVDGMTPYEAMVAAGGIVTPEQEFGGRPKPRFLLDELEAGARAQAEERRLAEERAKERLAKQMKDKLQ